MILKPSSYTSVVTKPPRNIAKNDRVAFDLVFVEILLPQLSILEIVKPNNDVGDERIEVGEYYVRYQRSIISIKVGDGKVAKIGQLFRCVPFTVSKV